MASSYLGLPPLSPALKSLAPFLQRSDELKDKEPIVAYWCLYYAAQNGIALKAKDNASRALLLELLGTLEKMKQDIGPNETLDMEAASAAYVENFAIKIFNIADNEDRSGNSTRSTAKKFLAAANFLEILKVFPKTEITESVEEKIRYAKWKAADIAKAFREGRKPTPGPAGGETEAQSPELELPHVPPPLNLTESSMTMPAASHSPKHTSSSPSSRSPVQSSPKSSSPSTPPTLKRTTPSPTIQHMPPPQLTPPRATLGLGVDGPSIDPSSPGNWSTVATPGTVTMPGSPSETPNLGTVPTHIPTTEQGKQKSKKRSGSESSTNSNESSSSSLRRRKDSSASSSPKKVHFLPEIGPGSGSPPKSTSLPQTHKRSRSGSNASLTTPDSRLPPTTHISPPPPPPQIPNSYSTAHSSGPTYFAPPVAPSVPGSNHVSSSTIYIPPPDKDVELTPSLVSQAQKHCRYAISSLDYDDVKQAKKELRAALALLGASV